MSIDIDIKQQVRDFYNQVGWQDLGEGVYQNARYEDLRPVSREYIHRCHLRLARHLQPQGHFLLDAGSGPIQYPEYLEYSRGYRYRVCADISVVALQEARKRIGERGLYVVADIACLPFKADCFDGVVSLHTIHHLPFEEHIQGYRELYRTLAPGSTAAVVNGWDSAPLAELSKVLVRLAERLYALKQHLLRRPVSVKDGVDDRREGQKASPASKGTYVRKHNAGWLIHEVGAYLPLKIWTWRSVSVRFLRTFIHKRWGGRRLLRGLFWLEERFPHFLGKNGNYPLIIIRKEENGWKLANSI
jgi:hypothetical protein